jgi:hypothetical protein
VEDKTTLKGAVIASTHSTGSGQAGDLTLETGSLEYSNIKDRDKSFNIGGGANFGSTQTSKGDKTTYSANANYEFTDKKQTNFATIGEGNIIITDSDASAGSATTLDKLNRDLTVAQYNTKDGGLKGGFTIDDATLEFMTNPEKMVTDTLDSLKQGYYDAKDTTNKIINTAAEITNNLFKTEEEGKSDKQATNEKDDKVKAEEKQEQKTKDIELLDGNENEVAKLQLILEKMANGEPLTNEEKAETLTSFFASIRQIKDGGSTLQAELENVINNDPESFREIMNNAGFNVDNEGDVQAFAKKTQASQCVQLTMFIQGVMNGYIDPASMGEYFKTAVENGLVDEKGYQKKPTQEVFDTIYGEGKVQVIGCGTDPGGGTFKDASGNPTGKPGGNEIINNLSQAMTDSNATDITVRVKTDTGGYHNMSIVNNGNGTYTLYDTSYRQTSNKQKGITVDSDKFSTYISPDTIQSFYYVKKK